MLFAIISGFDPCDPKQGITVQFIWKLFWEIYSYTYINKNQNNLSYNIYFRINLINKIKIVYTVLTFKTYQMNMPNM